MFIHGINAKSKFFQKAISMFRLFSSKPVNIQLEERPQESKNAERKEDIEITERDEETFQSRMKDITVTLELIQQEALAYKPKWRKRVLFVDKSVKCLFPDKAYPLKKTKKFKSSRKRRKKRKMNLF